MACSLGRVPSRTGKADPMSGECGVSLDALLADPSRATQLSPEEAVALLGSLATLQVALLRTACSPAEAQHRKVEGPEQDRMLGVEEAAQVLGVTKRWLYRHAKQLPFTRPISRKIVRFSQSGIARWLAAKRL